jgi:hypothetical protein
LLCRLALFLEIVGLQRSAGEIGQFARNRLAAGPLVDGLVAGQEQPDYVEPKLVLAEHHQVRKIVIADPEPVAVAGTSGFSQRATMSRARFTVVMGGREDYNPGRERRVSGDAGVRRMCVLGGGLRGDSADAVSRCTVRAAAQDQAETFDDSLAPVSFAAEVFPAKHQCYREYQC